MPNIDVFFFASLREELGLDKVSVDLSGPISIKDLKVVVADQIKMKEAFSTKGLQASIDFEFARDSSVVNPEVVKEVAFFPPVTGG